MNFSSSFSNDWSTRKSLAMNIIPFFRRNPFCIIFCCHNYVQLQFHKSMIYSYGLHFYSIRLPLHTQNIAFIAKSFGFIFFFIGHEIFFDIHREILCFFFDYKSLTRFWIVRVWNCFLLFRVFYKE